MSMLPPLPPSPMPFISEPNPTAAPVAPAPPATLPASTRSSSAVPTLRTRQSLVRSSSFTARPQSAAPVVLAPPPPPPHTQMAIVPPGSLLLAETSLELAQARGALHEAHLTRERLARSLAEYIARVRQYEELARAACADRDELAVGYAQRLLRAEKERDDAVRALGRLRAKPQADSSGSESSATPSTPNDSADEILKGLADVALVKKEPSSMSMPTPETSPVVSLFPSHFKRVDSSCESDFKAHQPSLEDVSAERSRLLGGLPVPLNMPQIEPKPFQIPARFTFADVFGHTLGNTVTSTALAGYQILPDATTVWPGQDIHGYFFTPVFRCFSLSVAGTFRWYEMDVKGSLEKPTECFYAMKDGNWYYAGVYKGIRMRDVTPAEWMAFPAERKNAIIAETLRERRAVAPQLQMDVRQMYELGALRVACVALQCTGYNETVCDSVYKHVDRCRKLGQWKAVPFE